MMAKYMATIGILLLVALAPFAAAQENEFSITVDEGLKRVHLKTGGQTHLAFYSKSTLQIRINTIPQKPILKSGETLTCEIILVESASPQKLVSLYEKIKG